MVVLEKKPGGNKHLHGIIQCLPGIEKIKYKLAFNAAYCKCRSVKGFVSDIEETRNEENWKHYITKYQQIENQPDWLELDHVDRSEVFDFDFRFSPNFPHWKNAEM
jgi:hypothetical protein